MLEYIDLSLGFQEHIDLFLWLQEYIDLFLGLQDHIRYNSSQVCNSCKTLTTNR